MSGKCYEHSYDLFGVTLHLSTNSLRIHEEARLFLGSHEVNSAGEPHYRLRFDECESLPDLGRPLLRACHGHECQILEQGHQLFLAAAEGVACFDSRERRGQGYVFPLEDGPMYPRGSVPLIHPLVVRIMFAEGFLPLHAAGVVLAEGLLLLSGEKGAGKSTLALKLHLRGFPLVCDDLLYLKWDGKRLWGGGHCQPIKLMAQEARFLPPACAVAEGQARVVGKDLFSLRQLHPEGMNRLYPVWATVFLEKSASRRPTASVSVDQHWEVLRHLIENSPLATTPGYRARALEWFCTAGLDRFYVAQTSVDSDETVNEILRAVDQTPSLRT